MGYEQLFDLSLVLRMMDQNYELKNGLSLILRVMVWTFCICQVL